MPKTKAVKSGDVLVNGTNGDGHDNTAQELEQLVLTDQDLAVKPLTRAEVKTAENLDREQALAMVGMYYSLQKQRVAARGRESAHERGSDVSTDPYLITRLKDDLFMLEKQAARALAAYAQAQPLGRWAMSHLGVGKVIAAGLLANIDLTRAVTAGGVIRFAGLDSSIKWHGNKGAAELIRGAFTSEPTPSAAMLWLSNATSRRVGDLYAMGGITPADHETVTKAMCWLLPRGSEKRVAEIVENYPLHPDNAIRHVCQDPDLGLDIKMVYARVYGDTQPDMTLLEKGLKKRPYNAQLKRLCYLLGESFKKVSGKGEAYYGRLYRERKALEMEANESGKLAAKAKEMLEEAASKRRRISQLQRETWSSGKLQPVGLDRRACRYAVSLFLSHYHEVGRKILGLPVPVPWVIQHGGHAHYMPPPNWPMSE